jgi:hypothetical protein
MPTSDWDRLETTLKENGGSDILPPKTPEDDVDRLGVKISLLVLCVALFLAANWVIRTASFQKCSALENVTQRNTCYDELRNVLLKPPTK